METWYMTRTYIAKTSSDAGGSARSYDIKSTIDTKRCGRYGNGTAEYDTDGYGGQSVPSSKKCGTRLTYFTPGWSKVRCITMPYNRIDEKVEASDPYPEHVETCA